MNYYSGSQTIRQNLLAVFLVLFRPSFGRWIRLKKILATNTFLDVRKRHINRCDYFLPASVIAYLSIPFPISVSLNGMGILTCY